MKFLFFSIALVILTLSRSAGAAPVLNDNDDLREMIKNLQYDNADLRKTIKSLQKTVENQQVDFAELRKSVNGKQMTADSLFLATISESSISILPGNPIVWDYAPINPGGHYSTILGTYEAPVTGYYQFSVAKVGNNYEGSFYVLVDEVRYAFIEEDGSNSRDGTPFGSATINIELTAGQVVRIENAGSTQVTGTDSAGVIWSWFTGHLLYAL